MLEMKPEAYVGLIQAWDRMDKAALAIQHAQAADLTEACRRLEDARAAMGYAIRATHERV